MRELDCKRCHLILPEDRFSRHRSKGRGRNSWCRECVKSYQREVYPARKDAQNTRRTERKYSLGDGGYERLLVEQEHKCKVCKSEKTTEYRFAVDHDHDCCAGDSSCGKCVRGLLCSNCNTALGLLKEDPMRISALLLYLESSSVK